MYRKHFGLTTLPFENVPDPVFFFDEGEHARIRSRIAESLRAGRGLIVLTGPVGSGKTTMSQMIRADYHPDQKVIWIAEPPEESIDLLVFIGQALALAPGARERTFLIRDIREALLHIRSDGGRCLVILDEAHLMNDDLTNTIRILNNLEEGPVKLIQILLLGQIELMAIISRPEMEHFRQRIATLETLGRMNAERIRQYVGHRLSVAGGNPSIFDATGWDALALAFSSGGTPRIINSLCDRCLHIAFERNKQAVDAHDVYDVARGMGLGREILDYIITLTARERMQQSAQPAGAASETAPFPEGSVNPPVTAAMEEIPSAPSPDEKGDGWGHEHPKKEEPPGLLRPLFFLIISLLAFMASLLFFWKRSGISSFGSALLDLISIFKPAIQ